MHAAGAAVNTSPVDNPGWLERGPLIRRIINDDGRLARVTTVVAPSGYGKTTLLKQLVVAALRLKPQARPCVLYASASECEGHVGLFVAQLEQSARAAIPGLDTRALVELRRTVAAEDFAQRLPHVLHRTLAEAHSGPILLLLDDLHELRPGEPLASIIAGFIEADLPSLHFVFASQTALPWDIRRLNGHRVELTARELEFRREEIGRWLGQVSGRSPQPEVVAALYDRTAGWPGVVALSAMLFRNSSAATADFEEVLERDAGEVVDSLVDKLSAALDPQARYVLRTLSVVDRFDPAQAHAMLAPQGTSPGESAKMVELPRTEVDSALKRLLAAQLLLEEVAGGKLVMHPMVRRALHESLQREAPELAREAHRRAAAHLLGQADPGSDTIEVAALEHLVAGQDFERLVEVLEDHAEALFEAGYHRHLSSWLRALESYYTSLPFWANLYLGRVYSQLGEWDKARNYLDRCKSELGERQKLGDMWRWQPRVCMGYAAMYWRRGMHSDASTYCRRGLDFIRRFEPEATEEQELALAEMKLSLLQLLGTLRMEAGATNLAQEVFAEAEREATRRGMSRQRAKALKSLGKLATLRGAVAEGARLYEAALELIDRHRDVQEYAELAEELGTSRLMTGDAKAAQSMLDSALAIHLDTGHPAAIARAHTALARCYAMVNRFEEADRAHHEAVRLLDAIGNLKTRAEILDRFATFLARQGRTYEAKSMFERAATVLSGLVRPEAPLAALHKEAAVELAAARRRHEEALGLVNQAVDSYQRLGARYDVARMYWRAAELHHTLFVSDRRDTPESVISFLELASTIANLQGYAFSPMLLSGELVAVGLEFGLPETQAFSDRAAEHIRSSGQTFALSDAATKRYQRFQQRLDRDDDFVITTREGRRGASENAVDEVIDTRSTRSLVVVLHDNHMWNYGDEVSLGQKRVILPLLVHFLQNGDKAFTMAELASSVWDAPQMDDSIKTKVKVAISRLRALLGKTRPYIVTGRRTDVAGRSVVTYGLHPNIDYVLVEPLAPQSF